MSSTSIRLLVYAPILILLLLYIFFSIFPTIRLVFAQNLEPKANIKKSNKSTPASKTEILPKNTNASSLSTVRSVCVSLFIAICSVIVGNSKPKPNIGEESTPTQDLKAKANVETSNVKEQPTPKLSVSWEETHKNEPVDEKKISEPAPVSPKPFNKKIQVPKEHDAEEISESAPVSPKSSKKLKTPVKTTPKSEMSSQVPLSPKHSKKSKAPVKTTPKTEMSSQVPMSPKLPKKPKVPEKTTPKIEMSSQVQMLPKSSKKSKDTKKNTAENELSSPALMFRSRKSKDTEKNTAQTESTKKAPMSPNHSKKSKVPVKTIYKTEVSSQYSKIWKWNMYFVYIYFFFF